MSRCALAVCGLALFVATPAIAQDDRAFRLAFSAPEGCPTTADMTRLIVANSARVRVADPIEPATDVDAQIVVQSGGFMGLVRMRTQDGLETARAVPAATCAEAASAMALIAAIIIDPDTMTEAAEVAPPAPTPPAPKPEPELTKKKPAPEPTSRPPDRPAPRYWLWAAGEVGIVGAVAPTLTPDLAFTLGLTDTRRAWFAPSLRLSMRWASSSEKSLEGLGTASYERLGARISGCPLRAGLGPLVFRPCAIVELGSLQGNGSGTTDPQHPAVLWSALGATARAEALLLGRLVLGLEAGALFPFEHHTFYFEPGHQTAYQVEPVGFVGFFDFGVRFL